MKGCNFLSENYLPSEWPMPFTEAVSAKHLLADLVEAVNSHSEFTCVRLPCTSACRT